MSSRKYPITVNAFMPYVSDVKLASSKDYRVVHILQNGMKLTMGKK